MANSSGGDDLAQFYDSDGDDTFRTEGATAEMSGEGFLNMSTGFARTFGYSRNGNDTALMFDTPGDDLYRTYPTEVIMSGDGIINTAKNIAL